MNWVLLVAAVLATVGFAVHPPLASAYGIAVTVTTLITKVLTFFDVRDRQSHLPFVARSRAGRRG